MESVIYTHTPIKILAEYNFAPKILINLTYTPTRNYDVYRNIARHMRLTKLAEKGRYKFSLNTNVQDNSALLIASFAKTVESLSFAVVLLQSLVGRGT